MWSQKVLVSIAVLAATALASAGVIGCGSSGATPGQSGTSPGVAGASATPQGGAGQRIYLTGVGANGKRIARLSIPAADTAMNQGGGGCAACHGPAARGKSQRVGDTIIDAPNITYDSLVEAGYTDATIAGAITVGLDESHQPLEPVMPRWEMSPTDVADTIAYLKQLGQP